MVLIKFTKFGSNSAFGGFEPGDTMHASAALAQHLVGVAQVAEYEQPAAPAAAPAAQRAPRGPRAARAPRNTKSST